MSKARAYVWLRQLIGFAILLAVWEAAARHGMLNPLYAPAPSAIFGALVQLFGEGTIWPHLEATFSAALGGLFFGLVIGTILGVAAALIPIFAEMLEPVMILLNAVPRVVLAPLFVIWFGIGLGSKVAVAFVLVAVLIFFTVFTGIRGVDRRLVERVTTLGGGRWALLREVYLPSIVAWIMGNLKVAVGFAFTGAVVGEFVAATRGLGYLLSFAQSTYNAALMLALVLLIMVFVLLIFGLAGQLERRLLRWRG
jgi:NitT/TauT family transport system permease protein